MSLMQSMLQAGVHYGHQRRFWNSKMHPFIFGSNHGIHIINLEKTVPMFERAIDYIGKIARKKGKILFVSTKIQSRTILEKEATRCGMPYVNHRWLGGMLTNYHTIRQSIKRLRALEKMREGDVFSSLTKKEVLRHLQEITKLKKSLDGIRNMGTLPDIVLIIDSKREHIAIKEANRLGIVVVAIVDTNSSPDGIDYVIPGNDDSMKAISFYLRHFSDIIIKQSEKSLIK
jgi:small subunit ribosomal protein S2